MLDFWLTVPSSIVHSTSDILSSLLLELFSHIFITFGSGIQVWHTNTWLLKMNTHIILQQSNPDVEGPQAAEHTLHEEELENVSKVKDPNGGRVSGSHVISFSHDLPPLWNHFLHQ